MSFGSVLRWMAKKESAEFFLIIIRSRIEVSDYSAWMPLIIYCWSWRAFNVFQVYQSVLHYLQAVLFIKSPNNCHEYLMRHSLKSGGTKDHFRWIKLPRITSIRPEIVLDLNMHEIFTFRCWATINRQCVYFQTWC